MPVINLDRYTWLNGFGAADSSGPLKLYNGPDGKFDPARFAELNSILTEYLTRAETLVAELEKTANDNVHWYTIELLSPKESAARSILKFLPDAKARLGVLRQQANAAATDRNSSLWNAEPGSSGSTAYQQLLGNVTAELNYLSSQKGVLGWAVDQGFFTALLDRALVMTKQTYEYAGKAGSEALKLIEDSFDTTKKNLQAGLWLARNWYWIALGVGALYFIVPPLIKTGRAYRKGGYDAAAEEFEGALRRGAETVASGTKAAAAAAKKAAQAGAAAYTGNPTLLMSGAPRRRRRRSYRRVF